MTDIKTLKLDEDKLRVLLSIDLITALINTLIHMKEGKEALPETKKKYIDAYIEVWSKGLENKVQRVYQRQAKTFKDDDLTTDGARVIAEVLNTQGTLLRYEFIEQVRTSLYQSLIGHVGV